VLDTRRTSEKDAKTADALVRKVSALLCTRWRVASGEVQAPGPSKAFGTLCRMALLTRPQPCRWLLVALVPVVLLAPRWEMSGKWNGERSDQLVTRMLVSGFSEATSAAKIGRAGTKWSPLESHKKLPRPTSLATGVASLLFLTWACFGLVHAGQRIRLHKVCLGGLGSRSPPQLQLA